MTVAAIKAAFADWRPVKSRSVLQLILEVPIEQTEQVLNTLGAPIPGAEKWLGVALLKPAEARTEPEEQEQSSARPKAPQDEHYKGVKSDPERRRFSELPLPQQVALRCNDERFQTWIMADDADHCARLVRERCEVVTRADINPDRDPVAVTKWFELERDFLASTGQMAEPRN